MHRLHHERDLLLRTLGLHLVMDFVEGVNLRMRRDYSLSQIIHIYRQEPPTSSASCTATTSSTPT